MEQPRPSVRPVIVRVATPRDATAVGALFAAHLRSLLLAPDADFDRDMARFPQAYEQAGARFLVAETADGSLVGMAGLLDGEIRRVFVDEHWRGRGIATRLVGELVAQAGAVPGGRLRAAVGCQNEPSRRLFMSLGFKPIARMLAHGGATECEVFEQPCS